MKKIPCPLPDPSTAEIELAKTNADARKRVRNQMLRVRRRDEEIARLTTENADCVYGDVDMVDAVDAVDNYVMDDADRYVRIPSWCPDVLCLSTIDGPFVLAHWFAIAGFLSVRTKQHT